MSLFDFIFSKSKEGRYNKLKILDIKITTADKVREKEEMFNLEKEKIYQSFNLEKEKIYQSFNLEKEKIYQSFNLEKEKILLNTFERSIDLLTETKDKELKKKILKQNLQQIEVEMFSYCNRKCWFCPNSIIDRQSEKIDLPEEYFLKILSNLKEIDYSGNFCFHKI